MQSKNITRLLSTFAEKLRLSRIILVYIILLFSNFTFAQKVNFNGLVYDSENNEPVFSAAIQILDLERYEVSNMKGEFTFKNIPPGNYKIRITHLAYNEGLFNITCKVDSCKQEVLFLNPKSIKISTITVTEHNSKSKFDDLHELSNVIKGKELQKDLGITLASTLKNETGIAMRSMGPAPARPVIRGLGSDRVLMSEDGNKTTDLSSSSPDHAVTIEPFTVDRIEVIRGPKVLLQTPTTIGGVVNVIREEIPQKMHESINGTIGAYGESVNNGYLGAAVLNVPLKPISIRGEFSKRKADDIDTPTGTLENSYSDNTNYSLGGSFIDNFGFAGISFRGYNLSYGVPGGFLGAHPHGVDITMKRYQWNAKSRINLHGKNFEHIRFQLSRVYYRHKEFEKNGAIGAEFEITNYLGYINLDYKNILFPSNGQFGISFEARDFVVGGFVFTPPSKSFNIATYFYETASLNDFNFEFSGRLNYDRITPEYEKPNATIGAIRERTFTTYSLSFSALYSINKHVYVGMNISKSSRVPTIEELFSEGPHLAAYSYEIGNPDLHDESGFGTELFIYHKFENLYFNFNLFRNDLSYYILPRNSGKIDWGTFLPIYASTGSAVLFYGSELQFEWKFIKNISFETSASYTNGSFKESGNPLPQIPPLKGIVGINYNDNVLSLGIEGEWAASQNRVDTFEEPTTGYFVINASAQYAISHSELVHTISLSFDNVLNTEYRNHLSRVKSILPEAGRNLRLTYKLYFH
jgi:iron complex outermembrane receptor protein